MPNVGLLSRALCSVGVLILMQNLMLLRWGSDLSDRCTKTSSVPIYSLDGSIPTFTARARIATGAGEKRALSLATPTAAVGSAPAAAAGPDSGVSASTSAGSPGAVPTMHKPPAQEKVASPTVLPKIQKQPVPQDGGASSGMVATGGQPGANEASQHSAMLPTAVSAGSTMAVGVVMEDGIKDGTLRSLTPQSSLFSVPRDELRLFGRTVPNTVQLCVGFSTVARKKDYVLDTVGIMLGLTKDAEKGSVITAAERAMVVTVAHLADFNMTWVKQISAKLQVDYSGLVQQGQFHGIHAPEERYPNLDICPPFCAYKDEPKRVKWRSKQNIDYAFLMYYAAPLAPYYLQIEDDILFSVGWVSKITDYISTQYPVGFLNKDNAPWRMIDFSQLGFIGKCFQSNEVTRLAQFLLIFYDQMPCDLLIGDWMQSMNQDKRINYWKSHPSLFQHVGIFRSLGGYQPLQETKFGQLLFNNPPGIVVWNFTIVPTYEGKFTYVSGGEKNTNRNDLCDFKASPKAHKAKHKRCWFWTKQISYGDHLTIVFDKAVSFKAVFIEFGHSGQHAKDLLHNATLQVADSAPAPVKNNPVSYCSQFHSFGKVESDTMVYWEEKVSSPPVLPVTQVRCFRIAATAAQQSWAVIFQIQVRS